MSRTYRQKLKCDHSFDDPLEENNPMNYIGNLADAMLVLAVGIMLALVMAYKVNLQDIYKESEARDAVKIEEEAEKIKATADEEMVEIDDSDLSLYGTVYMDSEGNLYILEE